MSDIYGLGFDNFLGFRERVEAVTRESVSASVNDLLKSESPCVAIVGPEGTWVPDSNDTRLGEWNL
jgi:predicted Zn-dependent peptidase